eukprot:GHVR01007401.1.p1 GENE.GHVR01007401.1~~GHVR01007401.1.p1  ORF type:complete len:266 (-),score=35.74 GHVR01007401.1:779-1576(-)
MIKTKTITDWKSLVELIEATTRFYPEPTMGGIYYRGQSDSSWGLEPSLTRLVKGDNISERKVKAYERQSILDYGASYGLIENELSVEGVKNSPSVLIDMQHYSCPTRLLDWSESPYIALYFAINESFDKDGGLYIWDKLKYDKNIEPIVAGYGKISGSDILEFHTHDIINVIYAKKNNLRLSRQQGCFSISNNLLKDHGDLINEAAKEREEESGIYKIIIPSDFKYEILARLRMMNVTPEILLPGLDGLGRKVKESLLIRKWRKL